MVSTMKDKPQLPRPAAISVVFGGKNPSTPLCYEVALAL
jgi:hypothetical protein